MSAADERAARDSTFTDALMDAAADAIIIIDRHARILRFNRSAQRIFGYAEHEVVGANVHVLMPEPHRSRHDAYLAHYLHTGKAAIIGKGREEYGRRKNGEIFPLRLSVGESRQGEDVHFVGIIHDLSQQRETEQRLRLLEQQIIHADRLVTLGELTAGISHEINQPLTAIAAFADAGRQLVERSPPTVDPDLGTVCTRIAEQARRAAAVVERLRGLARSGTGRKALHHVSDILNNVLLLFDFDIKRGEISVEIQDSSTVPEVFVDDIQIQQVLVNLVKNALDALRETGETGGRIRIEFTHRPAELDIAVADNGPGVSPHFRPHLFEPFFTSKAQGVGLGLNICQAIATAHGGRLRYEPATPSGSRFILTLPLEHIG